MTRDVFVFKAFYLVLGNDVFVSDPFVALTFHLFLGKQLASVFQLVFCLHNTGHGPRFASWGFAFQIGVYFLAFGTVSLHFN